VSPRTFFSTSKSEDEEDKEDKEEDEEEEVKKKKKKTTTPRIRVKNVLIVATVRGSHKQPHASPLLPAWGSRSLFFSLFVLRRVFITFERFPKSELLQSFTSQRDTRCA
jgi:glutaredoxin